MGSALGALKASATRIGIPFGEYLARRDAGEKWCGLCLAWHPRAEFAIDRSRSDGLVPNCRESVGRRSRSAYTPRPRPSAGRRFKPARDGDKVQARRRVDHLINIGHLPDPNDVPCSDCGHIFQAGERRHEYDHHQGYSAECHEQVEAVCTTCHKRRETERRAD